MPYPNKLLLTCLLIPTLAGAQHPPIDMDVALNFERLTWDGITFGEEQAEDRLTESALELELALEYAFSDQWLAFLTATLIDETEKVETAGSSLESSGLERSEIGLTYLFGDTYDAQITLGRIEFSDPDEWWIWWDESLDSISLKASYGDFETLLAVAEEQARAFTGDDFIDPEMADIRRLLMSLAWEFADQQSLTLYYLDHADRSNRPVLETRVDNHKLDESDADLRWSGLGYRGAFDSGDLGRFDVELHYARIVGRETVYEFGDPENAMAEVEELERYRVSGSAAGAIATWRPASLRHWSLTAGRFTGSGDRNPDDLRDGSFRPTGLQGDGEVYGELFRPELSNLQVDLIGLGWQINPLSLLRINRYRYRQRHASDEIRETALESDPSGEHRDLGHETDLVLRLESDNGSEWIIKLAEFKSGRAFSGYPRQTISFFAIEFDLEF